MASILLVVIYLTFIGLGIPDSLFGTAWPAIYGEFRLPVSYANFVTVLISGGTVISSLMSARLIHRFGAEKITAASTSLTALALLGFSFSGELIFLCLFAVPLGLGAGAIDSALNQYVAVHYKAAHMSFISCFYGVGITLSPWLMSLALSGEDGWRGGYRIVALIQTGIALLTIASLPIWKSAGSRERSPKETPPRILTLRELAAIPSVRHVCLMFIGSCAIEYTCNHWGSTFLTAEKGMSVDQAARMITLYYVGMTLGRFLSGVISSKIRSWDLIRIGQGIIFAAVLLLLLPLPPFAAVIGLFLVGLGNGPIFPNLVYLTPENFGKEISQSVMGVQMAAANTGILLMPPLFGLIAQTFGIRLFPYFLCAMLILLWIAMIFLRHRLNTSNRTDRNNHKKEASP